MRRASYISPILYVRTYVLRGNETRDENVLFGLTRMAAIRFETARHGASTAIKHNTYTSNTDHTHHADRVVINIMVCSNKRDVGEFRYDNNRRCVAKKTKYTKGEKNHRGGIKSPIRAGYETRSG